MVCPNTVRHAMIVQDLIDALSDLDPDAPVLFACDYGDYHHTTQVLPVAVAKDLDRRRLAESAYSHSGLALDDSTDRDWAWECQDCGEVYPGELEPTLTKCDCGSTRLHTVDEEGAPFESDDDDAPKVVVLAMAEIDDYAETPSGVATGWFPPPDDGSQQRGDA